MQKGMRLNDGHITYLALLAKKDGTRRGCLSKKSSDNTKWHSKWFALLQNMLFYFENDSSSRPSGLYLLEGCVCDRAPSPKPSLSAKECLEKQYYFTVTFNHDNQKALELRTEDVKDCDEWVAAITQASYRNLATEHETLMQKYLHLLQIVETEKTVAKQLRQQIEDGEIEIERLKSEIAGLLKDNEKIQLNPEVPPSEDDTEIKKIKKVQSFLRGWICRRKWKTIIQDYIRSPHAESMRKRNQVVFSMLEAEAEYVQQLHILVNNFLRPLRMAASSKKPPITHDDVSSIFLNSETIMFLHQIFYQGLKARIASWPTLVLADLFDILLPMLNIYQEFVRNHQYSLQILAHCKQNRDFDKLLKQYEAKPDCEERTLETFLTYPMFQIPRYILTLHELLAHTPHEHVERNSLDYAKSKLEELSRIMHDEVSETENIRKNLAIERMIVEGCEVLLDTSQTFVRQGSLIQVPMSEKGKITRGRLGSLSLKKEGERQCFLFSKHLIICTRGSGGKLHITKNGVVSLIDCTLMEEPEGTDDESKGERSGQDTEHLDFKVMVEPKDGQPYTVILVASSRQEKSAWTSDISQCIDNIRCNGLMMNAFEENSKVTVPQMIKSDTSLYCDDVDIRFSKMMNSCKVLQIRYASVERLLERLTDLRFLSIDFLNTFLHSYRVFTSADVVLDKLITIYKKPISAIPARSLELFFASSQNNKLLYGEPPTSPRASRKFSSPPPLSITKTSSPNRRRKLSLNIPIITGGKALDLAALSCSPNGYASMHSTMSPFSKTTLDINKLYVSSTMASKIPDEGEPKAEGKAEESVLNKQDLSVREECDEDPSQSDEAEAEMSPPKSPSTPKNVKSKNSGTFSLFSFNNGMVVSSCRELDNNRSALSAASAFAIATAGANEGTPTKEKYRRMSLASTGFPTDQRNGDKEFVIRRAATNRVLNVLRHWVSKHSQDFELNTELKMRVIGFLEEVMHDPELLTQERKAAANIIRTLTQEDPGDNQVTLEEITQMAMEDCKTEPFESHSALEIAEQLTLLDHLVFKVIPYEEFFGQGWMKNDKNERTPYIMKTTKHFNDISNRIATEILHWDDVNMRVAVIEKWVAVADICRCLHNYNAVLEITSSLNRSSIFRLKKTWLKVSKQTKTVIDKLQKLVSSEGRFKNLREALKNCDPPCVPYLGMYLTDLAFIEEGTPNYTEDNLVNFSKMRMISHIIREIRQFQQTAYKIDCQPKVAKYLLDCSMVLDEESLYEASLRIEPKTSS
ncbi:ras-specific guanine nucleotide-releasing factor 1-like isoform X2 [Toxotes jaculatrix]|uniref:ras-specific guanine nucleotide-releasing factor 1-like isoform X2 n=1 Tax=Toxotes jaculatrix TaxID=941984 RepID=UPI001B3AF1CF|nr:ras-specific guanine nucleotide-releasing factor 1-like isoform X2 [Toxotes jaculatrix]